jgi:hypothetical protein
MQPNDDDTQIPDIAALVSKNATENSIDLIPGSENTINQATIIYNVVINDIPSHKIVKWFKEGNFAAPDEEIEDQNADDDAKDDLSEVRISLDEKIFGGIEASSGDAAFVNTSNTETDISINDLPSNDKEIGIWYYQKLNEMDRSFVNACAVLHGATLRAIVDATRELYLAQKDNNEVYQVQEQPSPTPLAEDTTPLLSIPPQMPEALGWVYLLGQQDERVRSTQIKAAIPEAEATPPPKDPSLGPLEDVLERTYTYTRYTNLATRVYWKDTNNSGISNFSVDLLRFLAREVITQEMFEAQQGTRFLDIIKQWPSRYRGERSWRSANALGVIWWHQDAKNLLWRQARKWAKSPQKQDWEHAAALLDGAYQIEHGTGRTGNDEGANSSVLQLLNEWIVTTHRWIATIDQVQSTTNPINLKRGEGYAAARAYALIGRKSPEIALRGLEHLLRFPSQPQNIAKNVSSALEDLYIFGVLRYVDIARSGHIRQVLKHLAEGVKLHIQRQQAPRGRGNRDEHTGQNETTLKVLLTAFFLVFSCSLSAVDVNVPAHYNSTEPLPNHPTCPDTEGKDILLAGLLTIAEPFWQDQLATLLCAIILEKNYSSAFYLLYRWGEIVLKDQSEDTSIFEDLYAQFLVKVGKILQDWSADRKIARFNAFGVYKHKLTLWLTDRRLPYPRFKDLAQKVLEQLSFAR